MGVGFPRSIYVKWFLSYLIKVDLIVSLIAFFTPSPFLVSPIFSSSFSVLERIQTMPFVKFRWLSHMTETWVGFLIECSNRPVVWMYEIFLSITRHAICGLVHGHIDITRLMLIYYFQRELTLALLRY